MVDDAHAGRLAIQARVGYAGSEGLFDDVIGRGWFVLTTQPIALTPAAQGILDRLNAQVLRVGQSGPSMSM